MATDKDYHKGINTPKTEPSQTPTVKINRQNFTELICESNEKELLNYTRIEISRIFTCLNLPPSFKQLVYYKFIKIRAALKPGTKYRAPERLVPLTDIHLK